MLVDPGYGLQRWLNEWGNGFLVAGPMPELRNRNGVKGRRGNCTVIAIAGIEAQRCQRSSVRLMQHLPRLLITPGIVFCSLPFGKFRESSLHHLRTKNCGLPGGGQGISAKERNVNRKSCRQSPTTLAVIQIVQPHGREILFR